MTDRVCVRPGCGQRFVVKAKHLTQKYCGPRCAGSAIAARARTLSKKTWPPDGDFSLPPSGRGLPARSWWLGTDRDTFRTLVQEQAGRMQLSRFARIESLILRDRD